MNILSSKILSFTCIFFKNTSSELRDEDSFLSQIFFTLKIKLTSTFFMMYFGYQRKYRKRVIGC